jgi:hypothetical protein
MYRTGILHEMHRNVLQKIAAIAGDASGSLSHREEGTGDQDQKITYNLPAL